jgi:tRNA-Thr(GGU) m(6)t(6)A37 methyltransferase TsaA
MFIPKSYHVYNNIGIIRTPYTDNAPYQPVVDDKGDFKLVIDQKFANGLKLIETFKYIYVIYALDKISIQTKELTLRPPWAPQMEIGVFASRSPNRPNPIGLSIVKILKIINNTIYISGIDAFDGSPIIDIKPYLNKLDAKPDANYGWVSETGDENHLALHIKGVPHKH